MNDTNFMNYQMNIRIHSLFQMVGQLIYKWKNVDPVQIVPGLHLPRFTLEQYKSAYCHVITNTGGLILFIIVIQFLLSY